MKVAITGAKAPSQNNYPIRQTSMQPSHGLRPRPLVAENYGYGLVGHSGRTQTKAEWKQARWGSYFGMGPNGKVGQALISELDPAQFEITSLDLPEHDSSNLEDLIENTKGHDALIHFAWKDLGVDSVDPINGVMYENAYRAAVANNIGLVIMGSSNHARDHNERETDGMIRYTGSPETANNIYGVEKQNRTYAPPHSRPGKAWH